MKHLATTIICTGLIGACVTSNEADTYQEIEECVAESEMREGESLDSNFQRRAAVAHCKKIVTGNAE